MERKDKSVILSERIQYISNGITYREQERNIKTALDAGISWIQLRWKENIDQKELYKLAESCKLMCELNKSIFIINDHIQLAKHIDADGVHLGLQDASIKLAKQELGTNKIIGGTANSYEDIIQRNCEECDYIGLGPLRFTKTKENLSPILGIEGYHRLISELRTNQIKSVPIYAIGGVIESDIRELIEAGIFGIAISSLINRNPESIISIKNYYEKHIKNSG